MADLILNPEWSIFLEQLAMEPNVSKAARAAGISPASAYARRSRDPDFRRAWDEQLAEGADRVEEELFRRAVRGVDEPVFYQGGVCGHVRKYSDGLLLALAKRWKTEFRERQTVDLNATQKTEPMGDAEKHAAVAEILSRVAKRLGMTVDEQQAGDDYDLG